LGHSHRQEDIPKARRLGCATPFHAGVESTAEHRRPASSLAQHIYALLVPERPVVRPFSSGTPASPQPTAFQPGRTHHTTRAPRAAGSTLGQPLSRQRSAAATRACSPPHALGSPARRPRPDPRQRGADMADLPGGESRLLVRGYKGKKADRLVTRIDPGVVSLVAELRHEPQGHRGIGPVEDLASRSASSTTPRRRTSPRQEVQWDHPGSMLSFVSGSAIKRITAGREGLPLVLPARIAPATGLHPPRRAYGFQLWWKNPPPMSKGQPLRAFKSLPPLPWSPAKRRYFWIANPAGRGIWLCGKWKMAVQGGSG
jgi:hypothetical protein